MKSYHIPQKTPINSIDPNNPIRNILARATEYPATKINNKKSCHNFQVHKKQYVCKGKVQMMADSKLKKYLKCHINKTINDESINGCEEPSPRYSLRNYQKSASKKFCRTVQEEPPKQMVVTGEIQEIPFEIKSDIHKIDYIIKEFDRLGFSDNTVQHWMSRYLSKKNVKVTEIFMKIHYNEKSLSDTITYQRQTKLERIFARLQKTLIEFPLSKSQYIQNEVRQFRRYMEDILTRKTCAKINEIKTYFSSLPKQTKVVLPAFSHGNQMKQFSNDLKSIEEKNGQLVLVSKMNRIKFQVLSKAEDALINRMHELNESQKWL